MTGSQFGLFGLTVEAKNVHIEYNKGTVDQNDASILPITTQADDGNVATNLFSASASLPMVDTTTGTGGVRIDTGDGHVAVDDVKIELMDVNLGAFTVKDFLVEYESLGSDGYEINVTFDLMFPQKWEVSSDMTAEFGDEVSIFSKSVTMFTAQGSFVVNKDELELDVEVWFADETNTSGLGTGNGLLGTGNGTLVLDWHAGEYSLEVESSLLDGVYKLHFLRRRPLAVFSEIGNETL